MVSRKARILLGKLGQGYEASLFSLAKAFGEAGFEVIYTELQDPEAIVKSALQESVDHIGMTTLPGADIRNLETLRQALDREGVNHITMSAGGFLDESDIPRVLAMGILAFFPKGTPMAKLIEWSKRNIAPKSD